MTFYNKEVLRLRREVYPEDYLCRRILHSKAFIDQHFAEALNLEKMAAVACLSKFHFLRVFKRLYGCTPMQHLASVRMHKAKQLLQSGASVTEACSAVGFSSLSSFHRHFKKSMGAAPSEKQSGTNIFADHS